MDIEQDINTEKKSGNKIKYVFLPILVLLFVTAVGFITPKLLTPDTITNEDYTTAYKYIAELESLDFTLNVKLSELLVEIDPIKTKKNNKEIISAQKKIKILKTKLKSSKAYSNKVVKEKFEKFVKLDIKFQELVTKINRTVTEINLIFNDCILDEKILDSQIESCNESFNEVDVSGNKLLKEYSEIIGNFFYRLSKLVKDNYENPSDSIPDIYDKNNEIHLLTEEYEVQGEDIIKKLEDEITKFYPVEEIDSLLNYLFDKHKNKI